MRCSQLFQEPIKPNNWRGSNIPKDYCTWSSTWWTWLKARFRKKLSTYPKIQTVTAGNTRGNTRLFAKQGWPRSITHSIREVFVISPLVTSTPSQTKDGYRSSLWIIQQWRKNAFQETASSSHPLRGWIHC